MRFIVFALLLAACSDQSGNQIMDRESDPLAVASHVETHERAGANWLNSCVEEAGIDPNAETYTVHEFYTISSCDCLRFESRATKRGCRRQQVLLKDKYPIPEY